MSFFLFVFVTYWDETTFNNNCNTGVHYYHKDDNKIYRSTSADVSVNGDNSYLIGSFCPTSDVSSITFEAYGNKISYYINHNSGSYSSSRANGSTDWDTLSDTYTSSTFYSNRCYSFKLTLTDEFNWGKTDHLRMKLNGAALGTSNSITCQYDDCRPLYYGSTCEGPVGSFTSSQCTVSLGKTGDGKCKDCTSATSIQSHCRKYGSTTLSSQNLLIQNKTYGDSSWSASQVISPSSFTTDKSYYTIYKISGYVLIPKTSEVKFKITRSCKASLTVNGISTLTLENKDIFDCSPDQQSTSEEISITREVGPVPIEILIYTGCSLNQVSVSLQWNIGKGYQSIDSKYLYHT